MLVRGLIIGRRFVQVRTSPKHRSIHIPNYQSSERESNQYDESDQMKFSCTLKNALLIIRDPLARPLPQKYWLPCCTLFTITVTCSLQIILLSNYLLPTISVLAKDTLLKTTCHFLLLFIGFDTLTFRKDYY